MTPAAALSLDQAVSQAEVSVYHLCKKQVDVGGTGGPPRFNKYHFLSLIGYQDL